jgi:hypothetical protein
MRCKLVLILGFLLFINLASAGFGVSNFSLQKSYSASDDISGWVNMNFSDESLNSTFADNLGNSITLNDLLSLNPNYVSVLSEDNLTITSSSQKLYFSNASFALPSAEIDKYIYNLTLDGKHVLTVNISISNAEAIIGQELARKKLLLENITKKIDSFPVFLRTSVKSELGIQGLGKNLTELEKEYNSSSANYDDILEELEKIGVPESVVASETANGISFIPEKSNMDLEILETIGGGNYNLSSEEQYKDVIIFQVQEDFDPQLNFKKIQAQYEDHVENLLTYVEVVINSNPSQELYFIIEEIDNLNFEKNYGEETEENFVYIDFNEIDRKIVFTTSEDLELDNLPFFISPSLSEISVEGSEDIINSEEEKNFAKWILFSLITVLLLIIFAVVYYILHSWYDRKYENYLFKNKNNLYNLIIYINNAKKKGMKDKEIESNLKSSKWSAEQIRYVMRKYAGKRTGLWKPGANSGKNN